MNVVFFFYSALGTNKFLEGLKVLCCQFNNLYEGLLFRSKSSESERLRESIESCSANEGEKSLKLQKSD